MIRVRNLDAGYGGLSVLRNVSIHVGAGELVCIIGSNGAGKSTLLRTMAGLIRPTAGEITLEDRPIHGWPPERIVAAGCALVPEGRQLFQTLSVRDNLILGAYLPLRLRGRSAVATSLERVWSLFPVLRERDRQLAGTLSGGEQQMLALARALMAQPRLLMMDEPSTGIAPLLVKAIMATVRRLREEGMTVLLVEQNARAALSIADRGYVLETGSIILEGDARDLLDNQDVQRAYLGKDYARIDE